MMIKNNPRFSRRFLFYFDLNQRFKYSFVFVKIMGRTIWIGIYILVGVYLIYKLFFKKSKFDLEYERLYNKVLNSDEYKVKGQYER